MYFWRNGHSIGFFWIFIKQTALYVACSFAICQNMSFLGQYIFYLWKASHRVYRKLFMVQAVNKHNLHIFQVTIRYFQYEQIFSLSAGLGPWEAVIILKIHGKTIYENVVGSMRMFFKVVIGFHCPINWNIKPCFSNLNNSICCK